MACSGLPPRSRCLLLVGPFSRQLHVVIVRRSLAFSSSSVILDVHLFSRCLRHIKWVLNVSLCKNKIRNRIGFSGVFVWFVVVEAVAVVLEEHIE